MLPSDIPIFPLPNVVLFPHVCLPLHIFEPRYRTMVSDALGGDRVLGMVLLKEGWEGDYEGRPPVYDVGCAGLISHAERLPDGRYNIVLHGLEKFAVESETGERPYRIARVRPIVESLPSAAHQLGETRRRLEGLVRQSVEGTCAELRIPDAISDHELVNTLAQYLPLDAVEKQALLEREGVAARAAALVDLLEMKAILQRSCHSRSYRQ